MDANCNSREENVMQMSRKPMSLADTPKYTDTNTQTQHTHTHTA